MCTFMEYVQRLKWRICVAVSDFFFYPPPVRACTRVASAITWLSAASPLLRSVTISPSICQRWINRLHSRENTAFLAHDETSQKDGIGGFYRQEVFAGSARLPTGSLFAGFVTDDCVCAHDPWPENPAGKRAAKTEVSPEEKKKGGGEGWRAARSKEREKRTANASCPLATQL